MTPEKRVQNRIFEILNDLKSRGAPIYCERRQAGGFSYKSGLPDLWFVYDGVHVEVEVKSATGSMSSLQETWEREFKRINTKHICCNNGAEFAEVLKNTFPDIFIYFKK